MALPDERQRELDRLWDSYFYPETNTLINKLNITDPDELKEKEAEITFERLVELYENPIQGNFDKEHWKEIHKYLFGDLYDWAGEYRYVNMQKKTGFTDCRNIDIYLTGELDLMKEELKQVYSEESLAVLLATYYVHLMAVHPFREGNGRSCREFLRELVIEKSKTMPTGPLELDWTQFDGDVFIENVEYAFVFRRAIEMEFRKAIVKADDVEQTKKM